MKLYKIRFRNEYIATNRSNDVENHLTKIIFSSAVKYFSSCGDTSLYLYYYHNNDADFKDGIWHFHGHVAFKLINTVRLFYELQSNYSHFRHVSIKSLGSCRFFECNADFDLELICSSADGDLSEFFEDSTFNILNCSRDLLETDLLDGL